MSEIIEHIMSYAQGRMYFTTSELEASFPDTFPTLDLQLIGT